MIDLVVGTDCLESKFAGKLVSSSAETMEAATVPSAAGFRNIKPMTRHERRALKDKVALEKDRLMKRSGLSAKLYRENAPQDSMGAQGNSFGNVSDFLAELAAASKRAGRRMLSNVELFEVWPQSCQWSPATGICTGRHPAPFARIVEQIANEAPLADELIAWEWHSCLSPYGQTNWTTTVYEDYKAYVRGG